MRRWVVKKNFMAKETNWTVPLLAAAAIGVFLLAKRPPREMGGEYANATESGFYLGHEWTISKGWGVYLGKYTDIQGTLLEIRGDSRDEVHEELIRLIADMHNS